MRRRFFSPLRMSVWLLLDLRLPVLPPPVVWLDTLLSLGWPGCSR